MISGRLDQRLKYARVEAERRFLLKTIPDDLNQEQDFLKIFDLYLPGTRLRLRHIESPAGEPLGFKLGQKYRTAGLAAHETLMTNIYLSEAEYKVMAALSGLSLVKRRYRYPAEGVDYSLDVFEGPLVGLYLAEVEGQPDRDLTSLPVPAFAVREVTDDPFFTGGNLAGLTQTALQQRLALL